MYKNILFPVDLSDESSWRVALPTALDLCKASGARLHVVTVIPDVASTVGVFFPSDAPKKFRTAAVEELRRFVERHIPSDVPVQDIVAEGVIYREIISAAERVDADLVVLASHKPEFSDYLLGANAAHVVRHCPRSVLVVRART